MSGASLDVMKLLLGSNPDAVTTADKARSSGHATPPSTLCGRSSMCPSLSFLSFRNRPATPMLHRTPRHTQEEKLPLHYAAAKGAPLEVMKLLLDTNPEATTAKDKASR